MHIYEPGRARCRSGFTNAVLSRPGPPVSRTGSANAACYKGCPRNGSSPQGAPASAAANRLPTTRRYRASRAAACCSAWQCALVAVSAAVSANNLLFLVLSDDALHPAGVGLRSAACCLAGLEMDLLVPEHVTARSTIPAKLYVRNQKFWMPSFSIHVVGLGDPPVLIHPLYFPVISAASRWKRTWSVLRFLPARRVRGKQLPVLDAAPCSISGKDRARDAARRDVLVYPSLEVQAGFDDLLAGVQGDLESHYRGVRARFLSDSPV